MQSAIMTIFMLLFGFPKIMIVMFVTLILIGTALASWAKNKAVVRKPWFKRPVTHPAALGIINFAMALCALVFISTTLFGFVIFLNSWNIWHQYEGQPHHETDFTVKRAYYQPRRKGSASIYASGTVEGHPEWMNLNAYVDPFPRSQGDLDSQAQPGTLIHIYFYPKLQGRARVVVYEAGLPDEAAGRTAMNTLLYVPLGLAVTALLIFLLSRLRRMCYAEEQVGMAAAASSSLG